MTETFNAEYFSCLRASAASCADFAMTIQIELLSFVSFAAGQKGALQKITCALMHCSVPDKKRLKVCIIVFVTFQKQPREVRFC